MDVYRFNGKVALLLLAPRLAWASRFTTNCTIPTQESTFITSANIRGTFDVLWSGLFTIFICIWTVQHLNVPQQRDGRDETFKGDIWCGCKNFFTKLKWMILTLILPEFLLGKALAELLTVKNSVADVARMNDRTGIRLSAEKIANWTKTHAYYAEMGGFATRTPRRFDERNPYAEGNLAIRHLDTDTIFTLRRETLLSSLPEIRACDIKDKSKGDFFVKAAAVGQVGWMIVQVVARAVKGLPITQLEITACAFAAITFVTYLLWWEKPQGVSSVVYLTLPESVSLAELNEILLDNRISAFDEYIKRDKSILQVQLNYDLPLGNDTLAAEMYNIFGVGVLLRSLVLGGIHCAAWRFEFPTRIEMYLWRASCITTVAVIPVFAAVAAILVWLDVQGRLARILGWLTALVYFVGRLFILFETIYSLFHLPPGAFITTWSSNIPHVA